jgi:hypothetical protein
MITAERLKSILSGQVAGYTALVDLLQRERGLLVKLNAAAVEDLAKEKDTAVLRLRLLEEERVRLMAVLAAEQGIPADTSLLRLSEITGDPSFRDLRNRLLSLLQGIAELNEFNRVLKERSSALVRNALNFLGAVGMGTSVRNTGTVCSREA